MLEEEMVECEDCGTRYVHSKTMDEEGDIMAEEIKPVQQAKGDPDTDSDRNEQLERLRRLEESRRDVEGMKKTAAADYNDQLKDINAEIADVLVLLKSKGAPDDDD